MSVLKRLAVNDEGFMFDPGSGECFMLNGPAITLLKGAQEGQDDQALASRLMAKFDVDAIRAASAVDDFLVQLRSFRLL